jgi:hypothetical protein
MDKICRNCKNWEEVESVHKGIMRVGLCHKQPVGLMSLKRMDETGHCDGKYWKKK